MFSRLLLYNCDCLTNAPSGDVDVKSRLFRMSRCFLYLLFYLSVASLLLYSITRSRVYQTTSYSQSQSPHVITRSHRKQEAVHRLPHVIIAGVRKSGTHALRSFLNMHPDVAQANQEVHYFDRNYNEGLKWYKKLMPAATPNQIVIETTPAYFTYRGVVDRIHKMNTSIKLIVVVREPTKRAISAYTQHMLYHPDDKDVDKPFGRLVLDRKSGEVDPENHWVSNSLYASHYKRWRKAFPADQIYFVSGENLMDDPGTEILGVQDFIGVSRMIDRKNFGYNATKGFYCKIVRGRQRCLGDKKGRSHPIIQQKVIDKLYQFFQPHNQAFYKLVGRDFGW